MRRHTKSFIYVLREKTGQFFILFLFGIIGIIVITSGRAKAQYPPPPYLAPPWANPAPSMYTPYSPNIPGFGPSPYQSYGNSFPGGNIPYGFSGSSGIYPPSFNAGYYPSYNIGSASYYGSPGPYSYFFGGGYYPSYNMGYASYTSPSYDPAEQIREVEVINDYAYLLVTRKNDLLLKAVDITDPDDPQIEKSLKLGDFANYLTFHSQGNYLYWISRRFEGDDEDEPGAYFSDKNKMGSIDISTPDDPKKLDTFETGLDSAYTMKENAHAFFYQDRAYIYYVKIKKGSTYMSGLEVIDLSDPQDLNQSSFGEIYWPNNNVPYIKMMTTNDSVLILCSYDNDSEDTTLYFIDISDPQNPTMEASLELSESRRPKEQIIIGNYLYLLSSGKLITVVNIQDITQAHMVTALELPDPEGPMILAGNLLYMADGGRGLTVLDVTSPGNPQKQAGYRLMKNDRSERIDFIAVRENLVFGTTNSSCLEIYDVSDPEDVEKEGKVQLYAGSDNPTDNSGRPAISGELEITLTHEAQDTVDLDKDGDIAIFGIDSLDDLNRSYEVDKITPPEKTADEWNGKNDRPTRRYTLHFSDSVDLYEIRDEYEEISCCVIVEFAYEKITPSYGNPGFLGYGWNAAAYGGYGFPSTGYGSYPLMSSGFPGSSFAQFNQFDPLRYQSGPAGGINQPSPWYPQSSGFPGGNWGYPAADTYSFGQAYPGSMWASPNPQGPIYSGYLGGNNPWSFSSNFNPLGPAINPAGFNMWGPGQYNSSSWGLPDAGAFWPGFGY